MTLYIMYTARGTISEAAGMCALTHAFKRLTQFIRAFIQLITRVLCHKMRVFLKEMNMLPDGTPSGWTSVVFVTFIRVF